MRAALLAAAVLAGAAAGAQAQRTDDRPWTFAVLGHIRGSQRNRINPKLAELITRVRELRPDFVVLTGDIIWGDVETFPARADAIEDQWNAVDSALAAIGVPVYRVPGNHDLHNVTSRDIWRRRYPMPPHVVTHKNSRLILLSSAFIPPDGDTSQMKYIGGVELDSGQVAFLRRTLPDRAAAHTFLFLHHKLWWRPDSSAWWREVHPLLTAAGVDVVFSGDYGPMKFSTLERDGVRYFQGSIENQVDLPRLRRFMNSRLLSSQFDVFFEVRVAGDSVRVVTHPVGEVSGGDFTPERWAAINRVPPPAPSASEQLRALLGSKKRLALVGGLAVLLLLAGFLAGWRMRGR